MATAWHNPYGESDHKAALARLNRERVQRRRTEWQYMKNIDKQFDIRHLDEIRTEAEAQQQANAEADVAAGIPALNSRRIHGAGGGGRRGPRAQPLPDILEFSIFLPATGVRCLAVAHGGASLWTGEEDGSIGIRNGATGQVAFTISAPPVEAANANSVAGGGAAAADGGGPDVVSTLYSAEEGTQMWVGTDSGVVRVYDSRIFVRLHEATHPEGPVTAFVSSFNGRTFSAAGQSIIKWATAEQKFSVLLELRHPTRVTTMKTHGYYLFVAGENDIMSYEGETGQALESYQGHAAPVTCLQLQAGLLLSGSDDGHVRVWEVETSDVVADLILPERENFLADPNLPAAQRSLFGIVDIIADQVTGQVWSVDRRGSIDIWSASSTGRFSFVRHIDARVPREGGDDNDSNALPSVVRQVSGAVAVDTSKLWSLGSNGFNMVWHSTHNVMESQMAVAAVQMEREYEEAQKEQAQWREFIRTRAIVYENLGKVVASQLAIINERLVAKHAFSKWIRGVDLRKRQRRQLDTVRVIEAESEIHPRWDYFQTWIRLVRVRQAERAKERLVATLRESADRSRLVGQARQLLWFARQMQLQTRVNKSVDGLAAQNEHCLRQNYFRKWRAHRTKQQLPYNKGERAALLERFSNNELMRRHYIAWNAFRAEHRRAKNMVLRAQACADASNALVATPFFAAMQTQANKQIRRRIRDATVEAMAARNDAPLLQRYYTMWNRYWAEKKHDLYRAQMADTMEEMTRLREHFKQIEHLHRRKKLLDHAEAMVQAAEAALEATRQAQAATRREIQELNDELEEKRRLGREAREKSIAEQVDDLIAMLKTKVLNLHHDFPLTVTIIKKWHADQSHEHPAASVFLQSHAALKRLVVTWAGRDSSADEEWPITEAMVAEKMHDHEVNSVLDAIKTMIVTFDLMKPAERSSLNTDREIQINAKWVQFLADYCMAKRKERLGAAADRVRDQPAAGGGARSGAKSPAGGRAGAKSPAGRVAAPKPATKRATSARGKK